MNIGVICPSEIAFRRFMPALQKCKDLTFVGISICSKDELFGYEDLSEEEVDTIIRNEIEKANTFVGEYGGKIFYSYKELVTCSNIDAVYIPLPPALHYKWAKLALECGKHVMVEKPATTSLKDTVGLVKLAKQKGLALHENYMFTFHRQLKAIDDIINSGELGDIRLYRISFGFPRRGANDFRYNKALGGGALIDAGGYTIRYAYHLLGSSAAIRYAQVNDVEGFDVDIYGSGALTNDEGVTAQIAFGMDNDYKCELEVWGSKGCLRTGRVLTAPDGFVPTALIRKGKDIREIKLPADNSFLNSIEHLLECVNDVSIREARFDKILKQAELVDEFKAQSAKDQIDY